MAYLDSRTGITWGYPGGADNWGASMNTMLQRLAYLFSNLTFNELGVNTPPSNPAIGDTYSVGGTPTGAWSSYLVGDIAVWGRNAADTATGWIRFRPYVGLDGYDRDTALKYVWNGSEWHFEQASPSDLNFDPTTIRGTGTSSDPYRAVIPDQVQSDWAVTSSTDLAYIKNIPPEIRNYRAGALVNLTGTADFNYNGNARGGHDQVLANFTLNDEQRSLLYLGQRFGASAEVDYDYTASSTRTQLVVIFSNPATATSSVSTLASNFTSSSRYLLRTTGIAIRPRTNIKAPTSGRVLLRTTSSSSDNFTCSGTVYYGIQGTVT